MYAWIPAFPEGLQQNKALLSLLAQRFTRGAFLTLSDCLSIRLLVWLLDYSFPQS